MNQSAHPSSSVNNQSNNAPNSIDKSVNKSVDKSVSRQVKVAIIGAGTAGQSAFKQVIKKTDNVVIINDGYWTTTCATVGCMPSKLLIAAAERAHHASHSSEFGIKGSATIDGKQVMARVQNLRDFFTSHVQKQVDGWDDDKKISGKAVINQDGNIEVNSEVIAADHIILATGSKPFIPEGWADNLGDRLLTSDSIFELNDLPQSIAVVGAGAIGLELAQSLHRLQVDTVLFNHKNKVGGLSDDVVNKQAIDCFNNELNLQLGSNITEVGTKTDKGNTLAYIKYTDADGNGGTWQGDYVLVATGRRNTLDNLGVEHLGVELDEQNRPKNLDKATGQIDDLNVYIVGDANAHLPLLHVASDEGYGAGLSVVAGNQTSHQPSNQADNQSLLQPATPMAVVFSEPQIANVGQSLADIKKSDEDYVIGEVDFGKQGRSRVMGVNCGILRLYVGKNSDKILGASMVAPDSEYMAHILATAITNELTVSQLLAAPFYHPTILEGLRTALRDAQDKMDISHQQD